MIRRPPRSTLFSLHDALPISGWPSRPTLPTTFQVCVSYRLLPETQTDRKSTRLNSSHQIISYAVFCLKKKKKQKNNKKNGNQTNDRAKKLRNDVAHTDNAQMD